MKDVNDFKLTDKITVRQARQWMTIKDGDAKDNLIDLIYHRFNNRYVKHLQDSKSGFLKMAVSCLMIEALESFRQGKKDTSGKGVGQKVFKDFFETEKILFPDFKDIAQEFYSSIRCGILHQAETTNGWRILRIQAQPQLDKPNRAINADKFVKALKESLDNYVATLTNSDLNSEIWKNALFKIEDVCKNCNFKKLKPNL